jgi:drug/metabolite transporter (DMT)-like permease
MTAVPPPLVSANPRGILLLCIGIAVFSLQDVILKRLSGGYPLSEAMTLRALVTAPLLMILAHRDGGLGTLFTPGLRQMLGRGAIMFLAYTAYYLGLAGLPMATAVALYFSAPLFITLLSATMLGEDVGLRRWIGVLTGFAGVIIMVRPGSSLFDWAALLPVVSGMAYALSMVTARRLGSHETAPALAFWGNAVFLVGALVLAAVFGSGRFDTDATPSLAFLTRAWVTPTLPDAALMMACGVIAAAGLTLLTQAYRIGEAHAVTPFEYSAMIWGVLNGWLFWGDWPDRVGWIGIAVIVAAGLYVLWREAGRARGGQHPT